MPVLLPKKRHSANVKPLSNRGVDHADWRARCLTFIMGSDEFDPITGNEPTLSADVEHDGNKGFNFVSRTTDPATGLHYGNGYDYIDGGQTVTIVARAEDWSATDGAQQIIGLIGKTRAAGLDGRYGIYIFQGNIEAFYDYGAGATLISVAHSGVLENNSTHIFTHTSANKGSGNDSLWVDGVKIGSLASANQSVGVLSTENLKIGSYDARSGNAYKGRLLGSADLATIHEGRMSDAEIEEYHSDIYAVLKQRRQYWAMPEAAVGGTFQPAWAIAAKRSNIIGAG